MEKPKVLYVSQEITPYLPDTPMSSLGLKVPQKMQESGFEVRTFMPKYGCINERRNQLHEVIRLSGMNLIIDDTDHPLIIKVATLQSARMQVYFIDNDDYFRHHSVSDIELRQVPQDNDERSIFYVRGVIETVKKLRWVPQIVHCSGWISALTPLYLKQVYADDPSFREAKIVYALHDDQFPGTLDERFTQKLLMDQITPDHIQALNQAPQAVDHLAISKLAIDHADAIIQAQPTVNPQLVEYAKLSGKPFLPYADDQIPAAYKEFYTSLL